MRIYRTVIETAEQRDGFRAFSGIGVVCLGVRSTLAILDHAQRGFVHLHLIRKAERFGDKGPEEGPQVTISP